MRFGIELDEAFDSLWDGNTALASVRDLVGMLLYTQCWASWRKTRRSYDELHIYCEETVLWTVHRFC
jgi:hypothetical protein